MESNSSPKYKIPDESYFDHIHTLSSESELFNYGERKSSSLPIPFHNEPIVDVPSNSFIEEKFKNNSKHSFESEILSPSRTLTISVLTKTPSFYKLNETESPISSAFSNRSSTRLILSSKQPTIPESTDEISDRLNIIRPKSVSIAINTDNSFIKKSKETNEKTKDTKNERKKFKKTIIITCIVGITLFSLLIVAITIGLSVSLSSKKDESPVTNVYYYTGAKKENHVLNQANSSIF